MQYFTRRMTAHTYGPMVNLHRHICTEMTTQKKDKCKKAKADNHSILQESCITKFYALCKQKRFTKQHNTETVSTFN